MPPYIKNTLLNFFSFFLIAFSLYIFVSLTSYSPSDSGFFNKNSSVEINNLGGVISAIEQGYQQKEISKAASIYQHKIDNNKRIVVGVNEFINDRQDIDIPILEIDTRAEQNQIEKLNQLKNKRDFKEVEKSLKEIKKACKNGDNLVPLIINCAKAYCTLGEIVETMKSEFGEWQENSFF